MLSRVNLALSLLLSACTASAVAADPGAALPDAAPSPTSGPQLGAEGGAVQGDAGVKTDAGRPPHVYGNKFVDGPDMMRAEGIGSSVDGRLLASGDDGILVHGPTAPFPESWNGIEVFDSKTSSFRVLPIHLQLHGQNVYGFDALTLPDQKVMIFGGSVDGGPTGTTETQVLDPFLATLQPSPPMTNARALSQTGALLSDGSVAIFGGVANQALGLPSPIDLQRAGTSAFLAAGSLQAYPPSKAIPLPNGKVLVMDGVPRTHFPLFTPPGGVDEFTADTDQLQMHAALRLADGRVLVMDAGGGVHLYDSKSNSWGKTSAKLGVKRFNYGLALLQDGRVLVLGGSISGISSAVVEAYDPATDTMRVIESLGRARQGALVVTLGDGRVLIAGGADSTPTASTHLLSSTEIFY